jgi:glycosidase
MQRRTFITSLAAVAGLTAASSAATAEHDANRSELDLQSGDGSHHPGPPRFIHTGEPIVTPKEDETAARDDLAPWNPDGNAEYSWSIVDGPGDAELTEGPVVEFDPDAAGEYTLGLEAPDGTHELTVRAFPDQDPEAPRPRIKLDAEIVEGQVLLSATATPAGNGTIANDALDVEFYVDDRDRGAIDLDGPVFASDLDEPVRVYGVAVGDRHSAPDMIKLVPDGDEITVERPWVAPEWIEDAVIYEIFTRRFPDADDATFETIGDRLDHVEEMGADVLWMTPFVETNRGFGTSADEGGPHGYHTTDYFGVDSDLGTMEEFEAMVDAAHERDIKVVFDLVINHTADEHPFFQAAIDPDHENHEKYRDWFRWDSKYDDPEFYFGWSNIPNLNYKNPEVRQYLLDVVDFWAEKVDGFRTDVAWGVPNSFWKEMHSRVKAHDSEFFLLDETIPYDADRGAGEYDIHYDGELFHALSDAPDGSAAGILDAIEARNRRGAHHTSLFMQYAENHDTDRYLDRHGLVPQLTAGAATFTLPGTPLLYYGQETGLNGWRNQMNWGEFDTNTMEFYQDLVDLRKSHPALQGSARMERIDYDADSDTSVAFARYDPETDRRVVVLLDFDSSPNPIRVGNFVEHTNLLSGEEATVEVDDAGEYVEVEVGTIVVLEAGEPTPLGAAGEVIAEFEDPEGDDHGPGHYTYPSSEQIPKGQLDLAGVTVEEGEEQFSFEFEFHEDQINPFGGELGLSHPLIHVYFNDPEVEAGATEAREGVNAEFASPYQHRLVLDPHPSADAPRVERPDGSIATDEIDISFDAEEDPRTIYSQVEKGPIEYLPEGGMVALVMSHDGYGEGNVRNVAGEAGEWSFGGAKNENAPKVIDLLTPEGVDNAEALAYDEDSRAQIPYIMLGEENVPENGTENGDENGEESDTDDGLPGFGIGAAAAGIAGGAIAGKRLAEDDEE